MKKLGVLGGMGPAASAEFMARLTALTPAVKDQEHIPTVLWSEPRVPDRTVSIKNNDNLPLPWLEQGIVGLQQSGCDHIVIPCNTAHHWYEDLVKFGIPITHIVDSVIEELDIINPNKELVGIMATQGTLASGLYQDRLQNYGYKCIMPTEQETANHVQLAIELIKSNNIYTSQFHLLKIVESLYIKGCKFIILGCTEIPLAVKQEHISLDVTVLSSIDCLAKSAIKKFKNN